MWDKLSMNQKQFYRKLVTNFASLSEAFAQKKENDDEPVAPIVNSKFQETVFQKAFNAVGEDISNSSYDASIMTEDMGKYLVGIKSFGINSGDQKIAQFKADSASDNWSKIFEEINDNQKNSKNKGEADNKNKDLYLKLAKKIARLRNERIKSSKAQLRGFDIMDGGDIEAVYHVLMPSKKGDNPKIYVGETSYAPIDEKNIKIEGATNFKNPTNFKFSDGIHDYKYTSADSQLLMSFHNKDIVVDQWNVQYAEDAIDIFKNIGNVNVTSTVELPIEQYSWVIFDKNGQVHENSGFNAWYGRSKAGKEAKKKKFKEFSEDLFNTTSSENASELVEMLNHVLFDKKLDKNLRRGMLTELKNSVHHDLYEKIEKFILRPANELYIPLPSSRKFNQEHPDFFGKNAGKLSSNGKTMAYDTKQRKFILKFMPSGEEIEAFIGQDYGKGIESIDKQSIMGKWILQGVFQLDEREPLTGAKLDELHINGIRVKKFADPDRPVELEFVWIDTENPPQDAIGWVSKNK